MSQRNLLGLSVGGITVLTLLWARILSVRTWGLLAGLGAAAMASGHFLAGSLLHRRILIFSIALRVFLDYKTTQKRSKWEREAARQEALWEACHERNAKRVYAAICQLEGLWVKAGQYLSTRADVIPEPYVRRLRLLQDALPPRALEEVYATVEAELGEPASSFFKSFDPRPLGTASIAQVHRAQTQDGEEVVVKVQHGGVKDRILQDLENLRTITEWVAWTDPDFDFRPVIHEWAEAIPRELDFNVEAENTARVSSNLDYREKRGRGEDPLGTHVDVAIPTILKSTEKVLIMTYMDGVRFNDMDALDSLGVDKATLVENITRAYAHQIFVDGFFNADPHPGNFLVSREPPYRPVLLDFGLSKELRPHVQLALAKMLLAAAESDLAMLLSSFTEMGLKLRMDIPDDAMAVTSFFFRRAAPAKEASAEAAAFRKQAGEKRKEQKKKAREEMEGGEEKSLRRNPVDAFPGELVFFSRVLMLLRGLSSMLEVRVAYLEVMRPFAEAVLSSANVLADRPLLGGQPPAWVWGSPGLSEVDRKVRALLVELGQQRKILGVQVCVYKDGRPVVDVAAGVLGRFDPRPVQPDSLFSVFSATKGVVATLVHWLADQGKLRWDAPVAEVWPEFGSHGKERCTVAHVMTHRAGLQNALARTFLLQPMAMCQWDAMLESLQREAPETPPGQLEAYHYLTFGWLAGGIVEKASGQPFQRVLEEALVGPLGIQGECYIGIPAGVESRLATLALDREEVQSSDNAAMRTRVAQAARSASPATSAGPSPGAGPGPVPGVERVAEMASAAASLPLLFNALFVRRAIIPAANGHFSARALARLYAALAAGGHIPPPPSSSEPPLGSLRADNYGASSPAQGKEETKGTKLTKKSFQNLLLKFGSGKPPPREPINGQELNGLLVGSGPGGEEPPPHVPRQLLSNPNAVDAFRGHGEYEALCTPGGRFGLGFQTYPPLTRSHPPGPGATLGQQPESFSKLPETAFGHAGLGGSVAFCIPEHAFSIAITVNKLSQRAEASSAIVRLVCSELRVPLPAQFDAQATRGPDMMQTVV